MPKISLSITFSHRTDSLEGFSNTSNGSTENFRSLVWETNYTTPTSSSSEVEQYLSLSCGRTILPTCRIPQDVLTERKLLQTSE
ncbi:hypothetical protein AGABI2DRAFT_190975 [Agaricus bisporus var. bisporus H97]|uniref:hypothetical protein n=1 Tax=Agaricus bisporus var. bisporus (strain H97 / ATCC MYA-4626 / FGSC 10389) TaxID=936046 RepID=UPI00029F68F8|nr:hypothetical protein AGABI2DRAFT_190975 [Agaricus bisporus var. bisporus H97]EKV50746.1 hypothetical protein AGABI2DRAFT_190975 [Agaricus bisporus var. bisporus H97]